jgi:hypothetical protein
VYDGTSATLGLMTSSTNEVGGTATIGYDPLGRLSQRIEPSGGGLTSPGTLTYSYYGDDTKKALAVASSALTESPLFAYSYRADGLRQTLVAHTPSTTTYQWQQTAGGRYTFQQAPNGAPNNIQSYNAYGEATAHTIPGPSYNAASSAKNRSWCCGLSQTE